MTWLSMQEMLPSYKSTIIKSKNYQLLKINLKKLFFNDFSTKKKKCTNILSQLRLQEASDFHCHISDQWICFCFCKRKLGFVLRSWPRFNFFLKASSFFSCNFKILLLSHMEGRHLPKQSIWEKMLDAVLEALIQKS